ncbi:unnamed protein product [Spirodela intermedia]|uniref:Uncharacterized protein n=1 Tax=Spirodela intermedia TaxID=51605 RepID=A0A7I8JUU4_SPIIN|nr:unnamed protein product [Spirodela intermedia]CAA6673525.1 unnamed protein product [Spirodela intermedia]
MFSEAAAPGRPRPSRTMKSQLRRRCSNSPTADTTAMVITLLCACRNFWMGKLAPYANSWGIMYSENRPARTAISSS